MCVSVCVCVSVCECVCLCECVCVCVCVCVCPPDSCPRSAFDVYLRSCIILCVILLVSFMQS